MTCPPCTHDCNQGRTCPARVRLTAERDKTVAMKDALIGDKILLRSELAAVEGERNRLAALLEEAKGALEKIERWDDFPATGEFWPSGNPVSYTAQYGSDGARDFMRSIARATLALLDTPAAEALKRVRAEERERCAKVAYEAACGWQELRSSALSSSWPEDAAKHLASEHAAFAIAAAIRARGETKKPDSD